MSQQASVDPMGAQRWGWPFKGVLGGWDGEPFIPLPPFLIGLSLDATQGRLRGQQ